MTFFEKVFRGSMTRLYQKGRGGAALIELDENWKGTFLISTCIFMLRSISFPSYKRFPVELVRLLRPART